MLFLLLLLAAPLVYAVPQGNSAWLYGKQKLWIKQIKTFNTQVPAPYRFNYLFPATGVVHTNFKNWSVAQYQFVVLYGYDLHEDQDSALPVSPTTFTDRC